ncbi:hypothetical protein RHGRI_021331 [Rhododendron griersonianum]|uniref:Lysine-specific demethylase JMJ25 n=1 Tax=Rhododendron griersonianum TaxID=479676 RepID=A0AAV6JNT0_9ERIC|nr:hypothetical protein RHGRI_021331 [Rhododendron griersonianum]
MDHSRSTSGAGDDNVGIPDDLRCKRSDGKQWRCTAMSMPDKTVCEKHYVQAKKRAANSALRASLKKAKRKTLGESDIFLESKSDDMDMDTPIADEQVGDYPVSSSGKKYKEKLHKNKVHYSPETLSMRSLSTRNPLKQNDDLQRDGMQYEENHRSYNPSKDRLQKGFDPSVMSDTSDESSDSSDDSGGQTCHQCRRNDRDGVIWCLRCDRRGYCSNCISTWYSDIPLEEIQRICPACRGTCNCKVCLRGDNLVKARIREIPVQDKLQYLHCLLSSVLPVVKQIHHQQCFEVELERKLRDLREASILGVKGESENHIDGEIDQKTTVTEQVKPSKLKLKSSDKFPNWKANSNASIPCPPKEYGGCGCLSLTLKRIFKMNWVAKLVKNSEEMVSGCKVNDDVVSPQETTGLNSGLCQYAHREDSDDNFLYCSTSDVIKAKGIRDFRKHWSQGEPVIVKEVCDGMSGWDPMVIWKGIRETTEEKMKDDNRTVKAIDCLDRSEISIELGQFIRGYSEGRFHQNGWPQMLKLKDWPSPSASEEFLLYQRPDFSSKLPLLEYIHSKWGLLNVAAKLPHYSLQNDVGPKIFMSYGMYDELGRGDSVNHLHFSTRDMVYLLVHTCEVKLKGWQRAKIEKTEKAFEDVGAKESPGNPQIGLDKARSPVLSLGVRDRENEYEAKLDASDDDEGIKTTKTLVEKTIDCEDLNQASGDIFEKTHLGAVWDVFRRQDVPKLIEYLKAHWKDFGKSETSIDEFATRSLHNAEIFLTRHHKRQLKEEFGVEPWSFEQHLGQAVFIPAGCPFQVRNLQSTVQLGLDFLSPESLDEAVRLAEEIRSFPNDHDAKLQMLEVRRRKFPLEVGKMSLYAASSAIKEVQKLVLDPNSDPTILYNHSPPNEQPVIRQEPGSFVPSSIYMQEAEIVRNDVYAIAWPPHLTLGASNVNS